MNGSGKSTLLRIMAGVDTDIIGETSRASGFTTGFLEQEPCLEPGRTVRQIVSEGVQDLVDLLEEYENIGLAFAEPDADYEKLGNRQAELQDALRQRRLEPGYQAESGHGSPALPRPRPDRR